MHIYMYVCDCMLTSCALIDLLSSCAKMFSYAVNCFWFVLSLLQIFRQAFCVNGQLDRNRYSY